MRLRQIPPQTGRFLAILAATAPKGIYLEIGTSGGYSTLWICLACIKLGRKLITFEILEEKAKIAEATFRIARVKKYVRLITGDARDYLNRFKNIAFCFLDAEKDIYLECYEMIIPNMKSGGIFVADNAISHKFKLKKMLNRALTDQRVDALIVPIGSGELICRKI